MSKNKRIESHMGKIVYLKDDSCLGNPNPKENRMSLVTADAGIHIGINGLYSYKYKNHNERIFLKRMNPLPIFTKETGVSWKVFYHNQNNGKMFKMSDSLIYYTSFKLTKIEMNEIHRFIDNQLRFNKRNKMKKKRANK
jgi:hypothetical protein